MCGIGLRAALFTIALCVLGADAYAQDLEPRSYLNTPVGLEFMLAGYAHSTGGVAIDPSLPLENAHLRAHTPTLAYVRALDVWGKSGKVDVIVPYARLAGTADFEGQSQSRAVSGFADPRFRFSVNLYGAPALSLSEFANYSQNLIVGVSLQVSAPLGQYDARYLLNIGTNRWFFKPELGLSKAKGELTLELAAAATIYTDNENFLGGRTRSQAPIYSMQGHIIYHFGGGIWGAVDATYYAGGRTAIDGVDGDDLQRNSRMGATLALPVNRQFSIKLFGSSGVSTRTGSDFTAAGSSSNTAGEDGRNFTYPGFHDAIAEVESQLRFRIRMTVGGLNT